jgi:hypothetical protein
MKSLNKIIPLVIYPFEIMISFNETDKQITKALRKFNITPKNTSMDALLDMDKFKTKKGRMVMFIGNETVIRLNFLPKLNDPIGLSLLQHEIFHAVGFILSDIDIPLNADTHEAYAYLIQYLTEVIYKSL